MKGDPPGAAAEVGGPVPTRPDLSSCAATRRGRGGILKKTVWALLTLLLLVLVAVGGLVAFRNPVLRTLAERRIRAQTGLEARIGGLHLAMGTARLSIKDFKLYNPAGFGDRPLLDLPELQMELEPHLAAEGRLQFRLLRLNLAELNIVRNQEGRLNLEVLQSLVETNPPAGDATSQPAEPSRPRNDRRHRLEFAGIQKLDLSFGKVVYTDLRDPRKDTEYVFGIEHEEAENLQNEEELNNWLWSFAFRLLLQELLSSSGKLKSKGQELLRPGPSP